MGRVTQRRKVHRYVLDGSAAALEFPVRHREDVLAVEEPLEIRLGNLSYSVTMRTPGDDFDLVAGFLVSEGVIWDADQLVSLRFCAGEDENGVQTFNVVEAQLRPDVPLPDTGRRVYTSSSCGICGTDAAEYEHGPRMLPVEKRHPASGHLGPMIPGHEFAGRIVEVGPDVVGFAVGDEVATGAGVWCGDCARCRPGARSGRAQGDRRQRERCVDAARARGGLAHLGRAGTCHYLRACALPDR